MARMVFGMHGAGGNGGIDGGFGSNGDQPKHPDFYTIGGYDYGTLVAYRTPAGAQGSIGGLPGCGGWHDMAGLAAYIIAARVALQSLLGIVIDAEIIHGFSYGGGGCVELCNSGFTDGGRVRGYVADDPAGPPGPSGSRAQVPMRLYGCFNGPLEGSNQAFAAAWGVPYIHNPLGDFAHRPMTFVFGSGPNNLGCPPDQIVAGGTVSGYTVPSMWTGGTTPPPPPPTVTDSWPLYHAENSTLLSPQPSGIQKFFITNTGAHGTGFVGAWYQSPEGLRISVTPPAAANYDLYIRYRNVDAPSVRQLLIGGVSKGNFTFPTNASTWDTNSWTELTIPTMALASGAQNVDLMYVSGGGPDVDEIRWVLSQTAPGGTVTDVFEDKTQRTGFSAVAYVGGFDDLDEAITWTGVAVPIEGPHRLRFRYAAKPQSATLLTRHLYIDGVVHSKLTFPATATTDIDNAWGTLNVDIASMTAGNHTVKLVVDSGDFGFIDVDYLQLVRPGTGTTDPGTGGGGIDPGTPPPTSAETVVQAESGTVAGTSIVKVGPGYAGTSYSPGYNGDGYVGFWFEANDQLTLTLTAATAGSYTLRFRNRCAEALGSARDFLVNTVAQAELAFPKNAATWADNTWTNVLRTGVTLLAGANTILLKVRSTAGSAVQTLPEGSTFNVKTGYGALGNGVANDTTAIQNAINAAAAATTVGAVSVVFFPAGTYLITAALNYPSNVILRGAGDLISTIKNSRARSDLQFTTMLQPLAGAMRSNIIIEKLTFNQEGDYFDAAFGTQSYNALCVSVNWTTNCVIQDCGFDQIRTMAVWTDSAGTAQPTATHKFLRNKIRKANGDGISYFGLITDTIIDGNVIKDCADDAVALQATGVTAYPTRARVSNNTITDCTRRAHLPAGELATANGIDLFGADNVVLENNVVDRVFASCLRIGTGGGRDTTNVIVKNENYQHAGSGHGSGLIYHSFYMPNAQFLATNRAYIDTLPFDGTTFSMFAFQQTLMSATSVSQAAIDAELDLLGTGVWTKVIAKWVTAYANAPNGANNFAAHANWTTAATNFQRLATAVAARNGEPKNIKGIFFDTETYFTQLWQGPDSDWSLAYDRGKQIMDAIILGWPTARVLVTHGVWASEPATYGVYNGAGAPYDDLSNFYNTVGSFVAGMVASTFGTGATVIDGGEMYTARTIAAYQAIYDWHKTGLANLPSAIIPVGDRTNYKAKIEVAFGVYDQPWNTKTMDQDIWKSTLQMAVDRTDAVVWAYTERYDWLGVNGAPNVPQVWKDNTAAVTGGPSSTGVPSYGIFFVGTNHIYGYNNTVVNNEFGNLVDYAGNTQADVLGFPALHSGTAPTSPTNTAPAALAPPPNPGGGLDLDEVGFALEGTGGGGGGGGTTPLNVDVTVQAETGTFFDADAAYPTVVTTYNPGYQGTGFVSNDWVPGDTITLTVPIPTGGTGDYVLTIRYINPESFTYGKQITVNGTSIGTIRFPPTSGSYSGQWQTTSYTILQGSAVGTIPLNAGNNTIVFTTTSEYGEWLFDSIQVTATIAGGGGGGSGDPPPVTPPAVGNATVINGIQLFPADFMGYANVSALPVHSESASRIAAQNALPTYRPEWGTAGYFDAVYPDFGSGTFNGRPFGFPYRVVPENQPLVPIVEWRYSWSQGESDAGPIPVPLDMPQEHNSDFHWLVLQAPYWLHEAWDAHPVSGGWSVGQYTKWDLRTNAMRPPGITAADAAGMPILPLSVRYEEVATGAVHHALRMCVTYTAPSYVWPANHIADYGASASLLRMGDWLRVKSSVNLGTRGLGPQATIIAQAMKTHGMIIIDIGPNWKLNGCYHPNWNNSDLLTLMNLHAADFELVNVSSLIENPRYMSTTQA